MTLVPVAASGGCSTIQVAARVISRACILLIFPQTSACAGFSGSGSGTTAYPHAQKTSALTSTTLYPCVPASVCSTVVKEARLTESSPLLSLNTPEDGRHV